MILGLAASSTSRNLPVGVALALGVVLLLLGAGPLVAMSVPKAVDYSLTHDRNYHSTPRLTGAWAGVRIWGTRVAGLAFVGGAVACFVYAA